ncbi:hypothetical protein COO60DRAFT_648561 [Scenedesmus sp. NREL 46B-D3]|nr:hypothetical protein COO60DRAFT_648561 [Scenedesmus sp. NREL 46B-D3]
MLLEAGARAYAFTSVGDTCLSIAAESGRLPVVQHLLKVWRPPVDIVQKAGWRAVQAQHWDAAAVLVKHTSRQDNLGAAALLAQMHNAASATAAVAFQPSLLDGWLISETEQQRAAMEEERRALEVDRAGLQQLLVGVACMHKHAAAAQAAAPGPAGAQPGRATHTDRGVAAPQVGLQPTALRVGGRILAMLEALASLVHTHRYQHKLCSLSVSFVGCQYTAC